MRALIIEDNDRIARIVAETVQGAGLVADICMTAEDGALALSGVRYDVLVLDLGLPDTDGFVFLRRLRQEGKDIPVLILTARDDIKERVEGLNLGADDYLTKPFAPGELAARVRALLRRPGGALGVELACGNVRLDTTGRNVAVGEAPLVLSRRETDLLELMMRRAGRVVSKSAIEENLYAFGDEVASNSVEVCVYRLRRNLEKAGASVGIHTVRGVGYLLSENEAVGS